MTFAPAPYTFSRMGSPGGGVVFTVCVQDAHGPGLARFLNSSGSER